MLTSLKEWEDDFFHPRTTRDLGITYQLGHPFGEECEFGAVKRGEKGFVVLDNNGIHRVDIEFCGCLGAPSEVNQLLDIGWFPATSTNPSTAATLNMLRRFHKLNLQARLPAYDFYNTLVLLTNTAGNAKNMPVCGCLFLWSKLTSFISTGCLNSCTWCANIGTCKCASGRGARIIPRVSRQRSRVG